MIEAAHRVRVGRLQPAFAEKKKTGNVTGGCDPVPPGINWNILPKIARKVKHYETIY
jgi:hypothetical protein